MNCIYAICASIFSARPRSRAIVSLVKNTLLLFLAAYILLFIFSFLPQEPLQRHIQEATSAGYFEKNYPRPLSSISPKLDMFTECIGIGVAVKLNQTLDSILFMENFGECKGLTQAVSSHFFGGSPYMRYIHGYQLFLKPLYTFFSIENVRLITFCVTSALFLILLAVLSKNLNFSYALTIVLSFFVTRSFNVFLLVTHAVQFWIVLGGAALAVLLRQRVSPLVLFGAIGAADALCTFLNMGSLSLGLPLLCYSLSLWNDGRASHDGVAAIFWGSVGWAVAFVIPWLLKWLLLEVVYQPSLAEIFGVTLKEYPARSLGMIFLALGRNVAHLNWIIGVIVSVILLYRRRKLHPKMPSGLLPALLPALIPLIWIGILPGQSGIKHASFINVIVWPVITALFLMLLALPRPRAHLDAISENKDPIHDVSSRA